MIRNALLSGLVLLTATLAAFYLLKTTPTDTNPAVHEDDDEDFARGPHNGRLLAADAFALEINLYETGVEPEFRVYAYHAKKALSASEVQLTMSLTRSDNIVDEIHFQPQADYLRGDTVVYEPHSFAVRVEAEYRGRQYHWSYDNYEGRVQIAAALAESAGIKTATAGPAVITENLPLNGRIEIDPNRLSQVRPRFPGIVRSIAVELGTTVKKGQPLLTVQSNDSLQDYSVLAPINGLVIKRNVQVGEASSAEPMFTIVDLSRVWVELDVFADDLARVKQGQMVKLQTLDGVNAEGTIDWLSPLSNHASQSIHARVILDNPEGLLRPGQFVRAHVAIASHSVALAVRRSAVQTFRDSDVVFAKFGDIYEVRMLKLGLANTEWVEVTDGLRPATEYVTDNSYLIKADIEKSGASHDH